MSKKSENITLQEITDWTLQKASPDAVRRIEKDLEGPDSLVREYLDWEAGLVEHSRLVKSHMRRVRKTEKEAATSNPDGTSSLPEESHVQRLLNPDSDNSPGHDRS